MAVVCRGPRRRGAHRDGVPPARRRGGKQPVGVDRAAGGVPIDAHGRRHVRVYGEPELVQAAHRVLERLPGADGLAVGGRDETRQARVDVDGDGGGGGQAGRVSDPDRQGVASRAGEDGFRGARARWPRRAGTPAATHPAGDRGPTRCR